MRLINDANAQLSLIGQIMFLCACLLIYEYHGLFCKYVLFCELLAVCFEVVFKLGSFQLACEKLALQRPLVYSAGNLNVQGSEVVSGSLSVAGSLTVNGSETISGNAMIAGTYFDRFCPWVTVLLLGTINFNGGALYSSSRSVIQDAGDGCTSIFRT